MFLSPDRHTCHSTICSHPVCVIGEAYQACLPVKALTFSSPEVHQVPRGLIRRKRGEVRECGLIAGALYHRTGADARTTI